jgi:hypothetical protein
VVNAASVLGRVTRVMSAHEIVGAKPLLEAWSVFCTKHTGENLHQRQELEEYERPGS